MGTLYDSKGNKITWQEAVIQSMKIIGRPTKIDEIYDVMVNKVGIKIPDTAKTPTRSIYRTIYVNSKDSKAGSGVSESLFFKKLPGVWGFVEHASSDDEESLLKVGKMSAEEGEQILSVHLKRERNPQLVKAAKTLFYERHGALYCEICGFCFKDKYGKLGENFIEAHHLVPVSKMKSGTKTSVNDFIMVCSNCHSMIHRMNSWEADKHQLLKIIKK